LIKQKTGIYINCEFCGKLVYKTKTEYNRQKHHFCSNRCQFLKKRNDTYEHRKCEICGNDIYVSKKSTQRFCSEDCQHAWQKKNTGFKNPKFQGGYKVCPICGDTFLLGKYRYENGRQHFCSDNCRRVWYGSVWSQSKERKEESRRRAANQLSAISAKTQTKPQIMVNNLLEGMGIEYRNEENFEYYSIDNYLPEQNLIIEVMGDYWHCSPIKYSIPCNDIQRKNIRRDKAKHSYIKNRYNIEILYLWEQDINNDINKCSKLISAYLCSKGTLPNFHSFNYEIVDENISLNKQITTPFQEKNLK